MPSTLRPLVFALFFVSFSSFSTTRTVLGYSFNGCSFDDAICDVTETCLDDGLFGQCASSEEQLIALNEPLDEDEKELLRLELVRLARAGLDWADEGAQCVLAYFKLSITNQLLYDPDFCQVHEPSNILNLLQVINKAVKPVEEEPLPELVEEEALEEAPIVASIVNSTSDSEPVNVVTDDNDSSENVISVEEPQIPEDIQFVDELGPLEFVVPEQDDGVQRLTEENVDQLLANYYDRPEIFAEKRGSPALSALESEQLDDVLSDILQNRDPDMGSLNDDQLAALTKLVDVIKSSINAKTEAISAPEIEEAIPLTSENNGEQQFLLKKDVERVVNDDLGLSNTIHKIVKGDEVHRVEGNRVYMRIRKENLTEPELENVIEYILKSVAMPNGLWFDNFEYDDNQLSFEVSRLDDSQVMEKKSGDGGHLHNSEGVAKAVYKRRKDIETLSGVAVEETGIGSGVDVVPVQKSDHDHLFTPILMICAFTITALISVMAVHMFRSRRRNFKFNLPEIADHLEGKAQLAYEELCRQRMSTSHEGPTSVQVAPAGVKSKTSSTSSWTDEIGSSTMDISTGHVILRFLQEFLEKPEKIAQEWSTLETSAQPSTSAEESAFDQSATVLSKPLKATAIHDSDPGMSAYIASRSPIQETSTDFWQLIWEQGIVLIVNLSTIEEHPYRYWPESGSEVYGPYEIHLVSEHIWSEDYLVRSFYLKNIRTNETRTITQFHYLSWPVDKTPSASNKSLLEFRRKVNKSYRGTASPILVHCSDGCGRTGTYCLIDTTISRITRGVKQINIAGSLEHIRDQREGMVANVDQYKLVFSCVAEEVTALIKCLPQ
ncbi:hypothetical protein L596_023511 [Steinernema carpocapsae]|uniref:Tyrosine-protein phosphatase domain-containing protein n=1 Tax=Steinernema carpocapsae TaxID=34508 RepID=A0A4U5MEM7_STECR|nr:hypothetical protein L596_023511 [Steinernema carpocapsae]